MPPKLSLYSCFATKMLICIPFDDGFSGHFISCPTRMFDAFLIPPICVASDIYVHHVTIGVGDLDGGLGSW